MPPLLGLDSFRLPTLHGFADARLQGGLNNFAPAALGIGFFGPHETFGTVKVSAILKLQRSRSLTQRRSPRFAPWGFGIARRGGRDFDPG